MAESSAEYVPFSFDGTASGSAQKRKRRNSSEEVYRGRPPAASAASTSAAINISAVQADKSCIRCRARRVRCDRQTPTCSRCMKREEDCGYPPGTMFERRIEETSGGDSVRIEELEARLASVTQQLHSGQGQSSLGAFQAGSGVAHVAVPRSPIKGVFDAVLPKPLAHHLEAVAEHLAFEYQDSSPLSFYDSESKLITDRLMEAFTVSLLDANTLTCSARSLGLRPLLSKIPALKGSLHALSAADQLSVTVLCLLGARSTAFSGVLGVPSLSLEDTDVPLGSYLAVGVARESACRSLAARAGDLAWTTGLVKESSWESLQALTGLASILTYEEAMPTESRFFLSVCRSMYLDAVGPGGQRPPEGMVTPLASIGSSIVSNDAFVSVVKSGLLLLRSDEVAIFLADAPHATNVPFVQTHPSATEGNADLSTIVEVLNREALSLPKLEESIEQAVMWVSLCFREYSLVLNAATIDSLHLAKIYDNIDETHTTLQQLQQIYVGFSQDPKAGLSQGDLAEVDHLILRAVALDTDLFELVFHMHQLLMDMPEQVAEPRLRSMAAQSELRVRKCLKVSAFYAKLYASSQDKHMLRHLLLKLETLPGWTIVAKQRIGADGNPLSDEFRIVPDEMSWLLRGLELACYFTPIAGLRLQELSSGQANLVRSGFSNGSDAVPRQQSYDSTSSPGASSSAGTRNGTPGVPRREGNGIAHPQAQAASYAQSNARASTASSLAWAPPRATGASPTADSKKVSPYRAPARGLHPAPPPHEDAATYGLALLQRAVNGDHGELEP